MYPDLTYHAQTINKTPNKFLLFTLSFSHHILRSMRFPFPAYPVTTVVYIRFTSSFVSHSRSSIRHSPQAVYVIGTSAVPRVYVVAHNYLLIHRELGALPLYCDRCSYLARAARVSAVFCLFGGIDKLC